MDESFDVRRDLSSQQWTWRLLIAGLVPRANGTRLPEAAEAWSGQSLTTKVKVLNR